MLALIGASASVVAHLYTPADMGLVRSNCVRLVFNYADSAFDARQGVSNASGWGCDGLAHL
jgi:hypothetical protein